MRCPFVTILACLLLAKIEALIPKSSVKVKVAEEWLTPPEPKPLSIADGNWKGALTGAVALGLRLGTGVFVTGWVPVSKSVGKWPGTLNIIRDGSSTLGTLNRPEKNIIVYEYEASPFCRKVRDACAVLDLSVELRPCPGARFGWSDYQAELTGGKRTVPYMVDPNSKTSIFESDDIVNYLFNTYGPGQQAVPWTLKGTFAIITCGLVSLVRGFAGSRPFTNSDGDIAIRPDLTQLKPITLYGYEASPFVKPVREALSSLGLSHNLIYCARGSSNRDVLYEKTGRFQVPYIEDPNTGVDMFESGQIVKYLEATYARQ